MKIRDDDHYFKGLAWLVAEAERLEDLEIHDKDMHPIRKAEMLINYNKAERNLDVYRHTKAILENPELKAEYRMLGWEFEEPEPELIEPEPIEQLEPEPEPEPIPKQTKHWLDD